MCTIPLNKIEKNRRVFGEKCDCFLDNQILPIVKLFISDKTHMHSQLIFTGGGELEPDS